MRQREIRKERGDAPVIEIRQPLSDPLAQIGGVAVARHEDEHGDEAVEAIAARQGADARTLLQPQDRHGGLVELLDLRLEKLRARIVFENVEKRLAGMAQRVEAGKLDDVGDLAPDQRDAFRRLRERRRREQANDAQLALDLAASKTFTPT